MRGNPSYHLGYSPHAPYGDLGFSFKKTLKRIKKKSKTAAKSVRKSSAYKKAVSQAKSSTKSIRRSPFTKKVMRKIPTPVKKSTRSIISRSRAQAYKKMSAKQRKSLPSFMKPKRRPTPSRPKSIVKRAPIRRTPTRKAPVRVNKALQPKTVKGPRGPRGGSGPTGEQGPRGYPGSRGQRGARGMPGKSISTTDRWKHKMEKDEMRRIYQNKMRLGRERNLLINNQLNEMQTRNAILMQRINEQEQLAEKNVNNATVYKQWSDLKESAQETIFPKLGGIDIDDEYVATSVSALPWLVLGIALITREG